MSDVSIYIMPQGGIGNQLFQLAAGLAVQQVIGGVLYMLPVRYNKHSGRDYRESLYIRVKSIDTIPQGYLLYSQGDSFEQWNPAILKGGLLGKTTIALDGYFQYLPAIRNVIPDIKSDLLSALDSRITSMREKYAIRDTENTVFIHVRRGDYLTLSHLFGGVGETYYTNAVKGFPTGKRFLVISDDATWCRGQPWLNAYEIVDEPDELDSLAIMASCKGGAIIANSTFSWWGASLSGADRVFYPSKWYLMKRPELFPGGWVCVDV